MPSLPSERQVAGVPTLAACGTLPLYSDIRMHRRSLYEGPSTGHTRRLIGLTTRVPHLASRLGQGRIRKKILEGTGTPDSQLLPHPGSLSMAFHSPGATELIRSPLAKSPVALSHTASYPRGTHGNRGLPLALADRQGRPEEDPPEGIESHPFPRDGKRRCECQEMSTGDAPGAVVAPQRSPAMSPAPTPTSAVAEMDREFIWARVRAGLARVRAQERQLGRPCRTLPRSDYPRWPVVLAALEAAHLNRAEAAR